jgi:NAD+ synthase
MIDQHATIELLADWIADRLHASGRAGVVLGASGGIDSALVATLARRALPGNAIRLYALPNSDSDPLFAGRAHELAESLSLPIETIEIGPIVAAAERSIEDLGNDPIRRGNAAARARMLVLYDQARRHDSLVIGTGNRSEALVGYTTLHGDAACDLAPIAGLYKDEVRALAAALDIPRSILDAPPSAGLWEGQRDEVELGISYGDLDALLRALVDAGLTVDDAARSTGLEPALAARVRAMIDASDFKRAPVPAGPRALER